MTEMQASIGVAQMDKLKKFCEKRKENFRILSSIFSKYPQYFILPEATDNSDPAWFSFIVTIKENCSFKREELTSYLDNKGIETRNLFAGNLTKQPGFMNKNFRIADHLQNTDYIMSNTFFLGTYPGLTHDMLNYIDQSIEEFIGLNLV